MKTHYLTLDALRGIAALLVVLYHRRWWMPEDGVLSLENSFLAVDFFFMLSGFVVAAAYERRILDGLSVGGFMKIRLIRLYPAMLVGTCLGLALFWHTLEGPVSAGLFTSVMAVLALPSFLQAELFIVNGPVWSLFFEMVVNLLFAVFLVLARRWRPERVDACLLALCGVLLGLLVLSGGASGLGKLGVLRDSFWGGFARAGFPFVLGVVLFRLWRAGRLPAVIVPWWLLWPAFAAVLLAGGPMVGSVLWQFACILVIFPAILILGAANEPPPGVARVAVWLGAMSYPVYVTHYPMLGMADWGLARLGITDPGAGVLLACLAAILVANAVLLVGLDQPVRRLLSRRREQAGSLRCA